MISEPFFSGASFAYCGLTSSTLRADSIPLLFATEAQVFFFQSVQLVRGGDAVSDHPLAHLFDAVEFDFPIEPLFRFVALVRAGCRVPLWLCHLIDVNDGRHVFHTYDRRR